VTKPSGKFTALRVLIRFRLQVRNMNYLLVHDGTRNDSTARERQRSLSNWSRPDEGTVASKKTQMIAGEL